MASVAVIYMFGNNMKFKNPFGDIYDGVETATLVSAIGSWARNA